MARPNPSPFLLCLALMAGCTTRDGVQVVELEVQPYLVPCWLMADLTCLRAVEDGGDTVGLFGIEEFTFAWDVRQTLRVEKRRYPEGIMDVPEFQYHARGPATRVADTAWEFTTDLYDTTQFRLSGDSLSIRSYPKAILFADSADRVRIADVRREAPVRIAVRPGTGGGLRGTVTPP